ncbi:MAG: hypothetical protein JW841_10830 [Deltaproteobacteria bacterium]|nr:hypothetical protein [Deltaproteobacteria bacterium]
MSAGISNTNGNTFFSSFWHKASRFMFTGISKPTSTSVPLPEKQSYHAEGLIKDDAQLRLHKLTHDKNPFSPQDSLTPPDSANAATVKTAPMATCGSTVSEWLTSTPEIFMVTDHIATNRNKMEVEISLGGRKPNWFIQIKIVNFKKIKLLKLPILSSSWKREIAQVAIPDNVCLKLKTNQPGKQINVEYHLSNFCEPSHTWKLAIDSLSDDLRPIGINAIYFKCYNNNVGMDKPLIIDYQHRN